MVEAGKPWRARHKLKAFQQEKQNMEERRFGSRKEQDIKKLLEEKQSQSTKNSINRNVYHCNSV